MPATIHQLPAHDVRPSPSEAGRVAVLGPLTIDGATLTRRQRGLIAALALHRENGATLAHLTDAIWPGGAPVSARASLQNQISRLRCSVGRDLVTHDRGRYRLGYSIDIEVFEELTGRSLGAPPSPSAIADLRAALDLWRGDAFEDLADDSAAEVERVRLGFRREQSFEALIVARLVMNDVATAVAELMQHTASTPFHERPWELLMLALHVAGRRPDAMVAYRRYESVLRDQLGIAPSVAIRGLCELIIDDVRLTTGQGLHLIGIAPVDLALAVAASPT